MKYIFTLILCLVSIQQADAQSLSLFNIDASNFPTMKAKFYAFDVVGDQVRPSASELTLTENGQPRVITSVTCPPSVPPIAISSVLTVDVSGSMSEGSSGTPNIDLAKAAARAWIQGLPAGQSECALSSFDDKNYLNQDFTTDRSRLLSALSTLSPNGGTNYDMGLLQPLAGSLQISQRGQYKRVVVFLSDGLPNSEPNTAIIVAEASRQNCTIFAVTLGMPCPQSLKDISSQTGGQWYENVTTTPEAVEVYRKILQTAIGNAPCEIAWTSDIACQVGDRSAELSWQGVTSSASYILPVSAVPSLKVVPNNIAFGKKLPTSQQDTTLTLTAQNTDFKVTGISRKFGSDEFSVVNTNFPLIIPKNSSIAITLRFAPSDSGMQYVSFEIATDKCDGSFSANGGFPGKKSATSTLKLLHPNGGETFVVGSDALITWTGVVPSDTVSIEYSVNGGTSWQLITNQASGLKYVWKNVPAPPSGRCLVRVLHDGNIKVSGNSLLTLLGHTSAITGVAFSPDGSRIVTSSNDETAKIWDVTTGALLRTLTGHNNWIKGVAFSPDGSKIATCSFGNDLNAKIWDASTGSILCTASGYKPFINSVAFSPDGNSIVTGGWDNTAKNWDANSGMLIRTFLGHTDPINGVAYSPDGSRIVTCSGDYSAKIWDANTGVLLQTLKGHKGSVNGVAFSPDGSRIVTGSSDSTVKIWDAVTGIPLLSFNGPSAPINTVAFSTDGSRLVTGSEDLTAKIWNANTGALLLTLTGHKGYVLGVAFSPDGSRIATTSYDHTAKIWDADVIASLQDDVSDSLFSITAPAPSSQDVNMLKCLVGSGRDAVFTSFVNNVGVYPYRVDSIQISDADATQFTLVSGIPPFDVPAGKTHAVEFRFRPTSIGVKTAQLLVFTQADTLRQTIRGEGIAPILEIIGDVIDFGKVEVSKQKNTLRVITIKNIGTAPLTITRTRYAGPNDVDFTTLSGGGSFTLAQGDTARFDLRFSPKDIGRTSGRLLFDYNGVGSPATVQLFGEGVPNIPDTARTTIIAQNITAQAGEKVNLTLKLQKSSKMQIVGAPTEWQARIHYNKSILFNEQTSNVCEGTTDSCVLELTGVYNPKTDELLSIPCIATLGNTDHSTIVIDTFFWKNSAILTEVATQNGSITLNGVCEDGGVRLFIPAKNSTSLTTRPNPAQDNLQIHYGLREPLTVTLELLTMTGQVAQTIINSQAQVAGQYTLTSDLSLLGNGVYLLRMRTNKEMLTTRVDVVK